MNLGFLEGVDEDKLAFVRKAPLERLIPYARPTHFSKGSCISDTDQLFQAAYFILSGGGELRASGPDQSQQVLDTLGPGTVFGALDIPRAEDARLMAVATEDSVVLRIDRESLELLRAQEATQSRNGGNGHSHLSAEILSLAADACKLPQKVVTMAFLSAALPASLISEQLALSLSEETGEDVVLVRLEPREGERVGTLTSDLGRWPAKPKAERGFHCLTVPVQDDLASAESLAAVVGSLRGQFRYALVQWLGQEHPAPWFVDFLVRSDVAYLFLEPGTAAAYQLEDLLRQMRTRGPTETRRVRAIACVADSKKIDGFDLLVQGAGTPIHLFVHGCPCGVNGAALDANPSALFKADLRRIAREIGGCLLGLALSSGAAKGFAHVGVLQVLEENGIEADIVAGASMGAYVGSLWAYGLDGTELERLAREMEARWALWSLIDPVFPPRQGFLRGFAAKKRLMRSIGTARFGDLVRPLRVVAGNLATLDRIVFSAGEVATAVHASSAVPGICVPVTINGETCIDGGVVDPLPVDVLREMGVSRIIAVDVIPTPERIRLGLTAERSLALQNGKSSRRHYRKVLPLDQKLNYFARGNILEILMRSVQGAQIRVAEASCRLADLVLRPDMCDDCWLDYAHPGKFIARGREEALRHLGEIKELATRKTVKYERKPAQESMANLA